MSQLLERLRRELERVVDPVDRAETLARMACHLARVGRFSEARQAIGTLREGFGQGQSGRVTVWTMLAEGLVHHYEDFSPAALDRISRAQLLGVAMGYSTVIALASVWKAHIEFERSEFDAMLKSLAMTVEHIGDDDHDAQTRLAIVLSNTFMICGDRDESHYWFTQGREHAVQNGDQPSVDALLYNRAAFVFAWFRALNCVEPVAEVEIHRIRLEIQSAANLQQLMGISALDNHVRLLAARILILECRYEPAIAALKEVRGAAPFAPHNFHQSFIDLEIAFCKVMHGDIEGAAIVFPIVDLSAFDGLDIDEQIYALWMAGRMAGVDSRFGNAMTLEAKLKRIWADYTAQRISLRTRLAAFARS